jgi:DNA helicase-2/ATP-dependent DNA helicase PcrA
LAFERVVNLPKRGVGPSAMQKIRQYAQDHQTSFLDAALQLIADKSIKGASAQNISYFHNQLIQFRTYLDREPVELAQKILEESGYMAMWRDDKTPESQTRLENLREFIQALKSFQDLETFLEHVSLVTDAQNNNDDDRVTLMTLHAAKGLEFDHVFLAGWEEGMFPSTKSMEEKGQEGLEEERRLAYVGITRAKKKAFITYALRRNIFGGWSTQMPSRFIREIDNNYVNKYKANGMLFKDPVRPVYTFED